MYVCGAEVAVATFSFDLSIKYATNASSFEKISRFVVVIYL